MDRHITLTDSDIEERFTSEKLRGIAYYIETIRIYA